MKNLKLSNDLKLNIIKDLTKNEKLFSISPLRNARINSKEVNKNDIFLP